MSWKCDQKQRKVRHMLGRSGQLISHALGVLFLVRQRVPFVWQMPVVKNSFELII